MLDKKSHEEIGSTPAVNVDEYFCFEKKLSGDGGPWIILEQLQTQPLSSTPKNQIGEE